MAAESKIEADNRAYALSLRIIFRKLNFGEGWPDRMLLYRGHILFIEYKAPGEKPTQLQLYVHAQLREQGFYVHVVDNAQIGRNIIKVWHDGIDHKLAEVR